MSEETAAAVREMTSKSMAGLAIRQTLGLAGKARNIQTARCVMRKLKSGKTAADSAKAQGGRGEKRKSGESAAALVEKIRADVVADASKCAVKTLPVEREIAASPASRVTKLAVLGSVKKVATARLGQKVAKRRLEKAKTISDWLRAQAEGAEISDESICYPTFALSGDNRR